MFDLTSHTETLQRYFASLDGVLAAYLFGSHARGQEEFIADDILHTAAEHYFQVAIQAALDIGGLLLSETSARTPESYADIFPRLAEVDILPPDFADKLVGMAKFRNVLVRMYLQVDLKKTYSYLQDNLEDLERFAEYIGEHLAKMQPTH